MEIYKKIKGYIDEKGLKQNKIAQKAGYSENKFSAMMTGKRKIYADDLVSICKVLNVSPEEFITQQNSNEEAAAKEAI